MHRWVVDAGPLIHLEEIGRLSLLKHLSHIMIPVSVIEETARHIPRESHRVIEKWANVTIVSTPKSVPHTLEAALEKGHLHRGETDCLTIALEERPLILLTDDLAARTIAKQLRIEVHGTVGLITYSVKHKWLTSSEAKKALEDLYLRSRLFVSFAIIKRAIQRLEEI